MFLKLSLRSCIVGLALASGTSAAFEANGYSSPSCSCSFERVDNCGVEPPKYDARIDVCAGVKSAGGAGKSERPDMRDVSVPVVM